MKIATHPQHVALADPTNHAFIPEVGYARAKGPLKSGTVQGCNCNPPTGAANGSRHQLQPPKPAAPMLSIWNSEAGAWLFMGGKRLGFTPEYLASHGWTYLRAAPIGALRAPGERRR